MVYQFKVTLRGAKPAVWRRFVVPSDFDLACLHIALQSVMGWTNSHLHVFEIGKKKYTDLDIIEEQDLWEPMVHEVGESLAKAGLKKGKKFRYVYDLGDSWEHDIKVEETRAARKDEGALACLGGARACPPEDCGGYHGYHNMLLALNDPEHEEHAEFLEWVGGDFDPEHFDLDEKNKVLLEGPPDLDEEDDESWLS